MLCNEPEAQFPLTVPPLLAHSLEVKQVPIMMLVAVDIVKMHCLKRWKNFILFKQHLVLDDLITRFFTFLLILSFNVKYQVILEIKKKHKLVDEKYEKISVWTVH